MDAEHHDPWSNATRQAMERIMALGVLAEAGSRLRTENKRAVAARRQEQAAKIADEARQAMAAHRHGAELSARQAREWARFVDDPQRLRDYLAGLKFQELARQWAAAAPHADTNPVAAIVLAAAETDLRQRAPGLMNFYDRARADGTPHGEAMAEAVAYTWRGNSPARPHGGRRPAAAELPRLGEELETALADLARSAGPVERTRLVRHLEDAGWSTESIGHVESILDRGASAGSRTAAQVAAESFPLPSRDALTAHPAAMPARPRTAEPVHRRMR